LKKGDTMANIREIAKEAGVSVATVSRVLNGYPYVREEKRNAVWEAVEKLNYTKNINAVHLAKGKTSIVGVMLPYVNHPYFGAVLEGISKEALRHRYHLLLFQTNYNVEKELEALEMMRMKQVDGLIVCSHVASWEIIAQYKEDGPIVLCEDVGDQDFLSVYIDHYEAFAKALRYLIQKGHRHIGYCIGRTTGANSKARETAYYDTLRQIGVEPRKEWIFDRCLYVEDGQRVVREWLILPEKPSALLVSSDQVAAGIVLWGKKEGVKIPDDLAIVSFDNHPISEPLQITTMELPLALMGTKAFRLIYHYIETGNIVKKKEKLPIRFIERASV
jgi:LacI family repressor for deo operon, udp, cdd, tsx, nupC, and nupG